MSVQTWRSPSSYLGESLFCWCCTALTGPSLAMSRPHSLKTDKIWSIAFQPNLKSEGMPVGPFKRASASLRVEAILLMDGAV